MGQRLVLPMLYSRRKRMAQKQGADVYQYESMSPKLRNQMLFIFEEWEKLLRDRYNGASLVIEPTVDMMRRELGVPTLSFSQNAQHEFVEWFSGCNELDDLLDSIEIVVTSSLVHSSKRGDGSLEKVKSGIAEINARALEDSFGFQIEGSQIIEIGSTFFHREVTVPALHLLSGSGYSEANNEFRQAFEEFKTGSYDDCIHDCCNAFESVLKIILSEKGWPFGPNDTAKKLLTVAFEHGLIPAYMQNEFTGLRTILESGVPTVRNKEGGHGTGTMPRSIPKHIAAFQLHQTASAIILLVEAAK